MAVSIGKYLKYNLTEITALTLQSLIITSKDVDKDFKSFWQSHCWVSLQNIYIFNNTNYRVQEK